MNYSFHLIWCLWEWATELAVGMLQLFSLREFTDVGTQPVTPLGKTSAFWEMCSFAFLSRVKWDDPHHCLNSFLTQFLYGFNKQKINVLTNAP